MEPTKLHLAICDDNADQIKYLEDAVTEWARLNKQPVAVFSFLSAEAFLFEYEENERFDILLLDIEMPGMDGIALAGKLRKTDESLRIIFVTGYEKYIADGYDVAAFHFLIKPLKKEKLFEVLTKASDLIKRKEKILFLNTNRSVVKVPLHTITYIEAEQNYVNIHTESDIYHVKMTLANIEGMLDESFFRTGKSFIVGLKFVKSISKTCIVLDDNTEIPLGRNLYDAANKAFINFY